VFIQQSIEQLRHSNDTFLAIPEDVTDFESLAESITLERESDGLESGELIHSGTSKEAERACPKQLKAGVGLKLSEWVRNADVMSVHSCISQSAATVLGADRSHGPNRLLLFCIRSDSIRAVVMSYLNALVFEMEAQTPCFPTDESPQATQESAKGQTQESVRWGIIEVQDILDNDFLELLSQFAEDEHSGRARLPRIEGIVIDMEFYEKLQSEPGQLEQHQHASALQYLHRVVSIRNETSTPRRGQNSDPNHADGGKAKKNLKGTQKRPISNRTDGNKSSSPAKSAVKKKTTKRKSGSQKQQKHIQFADPTGGRPFVLLISPLIEKTKVIGLFKSGKIDGSLTTPIKKCEVK